MKKTLLALAIAFAGISARAVTASYEYATITNGACTFTNATIYSSKGILQLDFAGVTPIAAGFTGTVNLVSGTFTQLVATVKSSTNTATVVTTGTSTNVPQTWAYSDASLTAGTQAVTIAAGNVIRTIAISGIQPTNATASVTIAQAAETNVVYVTCAGLAASGYMAMDIPAINAATVTYSAGTNGGKASVIYSSTGATVTSYPQPTFNMLYGDTLIFSNIGTNAGTVKISEMVYP